MASKSMWIITKRLRVLEAATRVSAGCNCRFLQVTFFHSVADLEQILCIHCPVHPFRDLGELSWAPLSMPLRREDGPLCSCPPSPTREWLSDKRGPLTAEEQTQECLNWEQQLSEDPEQQMRVEAILNNYYRVNKRRRNESMCR
jgi:hypothetical protein